MKTVIEMARAVDFCVSDEGEISTRNSFGIIQGELDKFAELVRKDYSFTHAQMWLKRFDDAILAERQRIVNLLMIQHEAAKGVHNYWHVAANLIQEDGAGGT